MGYGYVDASSNGYAPEALRDAIRSFPSNPEIRRIIRRFISEEKNGVRMIKF